MHLTSQDVANRLRPLFQRAVEKRSGVSYLLTAEERAVFSDADLEALKKETGYPAPAQPMPLRWPADE